MMPLKPLGFVILMGVALSVSGCATGRTDLVDSGAVEIEVKEAPKTRIEGVSVLENEGETIVYGRVRRLGVQNNAFLGKQVTAMAVFPDGSVHERTDRLLTRPPRARSFRQIYPVAKFKIVFPEQFPPGTTLVLGFGSRLPTEG
jgi:hypothetical protein